MIRALASFAAASFTTALLFVAIAQVSARARSVTPPPLLAVAVDRVVLPPADFETARDLATTDADATALDDRSDEPAPGEEAAPSGAAPAAADAVVAIAFEPRLPPLGRELEPLRAPLELPDAIALPRGGSRDGAVGGALRGSVVGGTGAVDAKAGVAGGVPGGTGTARVFDADAVDQAPVRKLHPLPPYPAWARARGLEGVVTVKILVDRAGAVKQAELVATDGDERFGPIAVDAVKSWTFEPAQVAGKPVLCLILQKIRFELTR